MNPSALSAAVLQRGGTIPTICACCGELFHAKTMQAAYCGTNCRVRAYYYRRSGRPIPPKFSVVGRTQPIRPQQTQPEIPNPAAQASAPWWEPATKPTQAPLAPFAYQGRQVRVVTDEQGVPWFVAADVCAVLGIGAEQTRRLDDDERSITAIPTPGGTQSMTTVNEPGLYSLILGSRKPEAKAFKRWVTHEVLPTIRRTGRYAVSGAQAAPQPPALPSSGPAILIRAKTDREAAQLWCDAVEATTLGAIRRKLSTTHRDDSAIPYSSHWQRVAA